MFAGFRQGLAAENLLFQRKGMADYSRASYRTQFDIRAAKNIFLSGNLVNAEKFSAKSNYVVQNTKHLCWPQCAEKVQRTTKLEFLDV